MGNQFAELPHWEFTVDEFNPGIYRVTAVRDGGITGEAKGVDPDAALAELRSWAKSIEQDRGRTKEYRAIVWIADLPGERVTLRATTAGGAMEKLRARYGEDAVVSAWNDEDASRPRG